MVSAARAEPFNPPPPSLRAGCQRRVRPSVRFRKNQELKGPRPLRRPFSILPPWHTSSPIGSTIWNCWPILGPPKINQNMSIFQNPKNSKIRPWTAKASIVRSTLMTFGMPFSITFPTVHCTCILVSIGLSGPPLSPPNDFLAWRKYARCGYINITCF